MGKTKTKQVLWVLALFALVPVAATQPSPREAGHEPPANSVRRPTSSRLVTAAEGRAIVGSALKTGHNIRFTGDCSHSVHAIYKRAGFPYRYADSSQLYEGIKDFRRVERPQAGDLTVWHGHAGIVVNPARHSFFGATHAGLRVESYDSKYWKHRGRPRFFRYVKSTS